MPQFTYTARAVNGDLRQATIDAPTRDDIRQYKREARDRKIEEAARRRRH